MVKTLLLLFVLYALPTSAAVRTPVAPSYTAIRIDIREQRLELFWRDDQGQVFHRFDRLADWLAARGQRLSLAMNAGMFEPDFSPVGLLVADGREQAPLNLRDGKGNFYLKPNGVFALTATGPRIVASSEFAGIEDHVRLATQSGPLLLAHGMIHPGFNPASTSRHLRNGIGVDGPIVWFVVSDAPVTFHEFARYFRDELHCTDALYLDGNLSSLYDRAHGRDDQREPLGPIIGVVEPMPSTHTASTASHATTNAGKVPAIHQE